MENEKELREFADHIAAILDKASAPGVMESWGLSDIRVYPESPFGTCWSAACNGLQYVGRIYVAKGEVPGTLTIAKQEVFGQVLTRSEYMKVAKHDLPPKKAVDQLDKWIERGNLSEDEYLKIAGRLAREDMKSMFDNIFKK